MIKTAVILTVYNRRDVTLQGLRTLYRAIGFLQKKQPEANYKFDIYMTDDGCTDGTGDAVREEFPEVHIIQGSGNLFWGGGMRKAWQYAIDSEIEYDFYLWFNDDADLYENALVTMFDSYCLSKQNSLISGAFCGKDGKTSYGGRDMNKHILSPNNNVQQVYLMNGNLALIPASAEKKIGLLDFKFLHIAGDWDYGLRARKLGYDVILTNKYVGITERHDKKEFEGCLKERIKNIYSLKHNPKPIFIFNRRHWGLWYALKELIKQHLLLLCPNLLNK